MLYVRIRAIRWYHAPDRNVVTTNRQKITAAKKVTAAVPLSSAAAVQQYALRANKPKSPSIELRQKLLEQFRCAAVPLYSSTHSEQTNLNLHPSNIIDTRVYIQ